ncbi:MAG: tetratricopeptide repeat protein [Prevotella sp.]|nr:tetratricopeptide repeat protein [Prevotella sp.]
MASSAELYERGNRLRREGRYDEAMNAYSEAVALDPDSPARTAREMLAAQFEFYCKDYYNP